MHNMRRIFAVMGIVLIAIIAGIAPPSVSPAISAESGANAPEQKPSITKRVHIWTRARIAAANKRWAQNKDKFAQCSEQLKQEQSARRERNKRQLMLHAQADFMQDCMLRPY
jgi:hypothetical protein